MAEHTKIEWARHPVTGLGATWNIVTGCSVVSPGCTNCYAMKLAGTRLRNHPTRQGLTTPTRSGPVWNGKVRFNAEWLPQPFAWKKPHGIFVAAHGDLFAEGVTDEQLDRIFAVMALTPQHIYFVLTKRPKRMKDYLTDRNGGGTPIDIKSPSFQHLDHGRDRLEFRMSAKMLDFATTGEGAWPRLPLPNVWLGVSVEDQTRADERHEPMFDLGFREGWETFVSYEPALGPVDWSDWAFIDWIISGGESGPRPSHPDWHRATRDFCAKVGVPYFFKQWGTWGPIEPVVGEHEMHAITASGKLYKQSDIAYPDGRRRHELLDEPQQLSLHSIYKLGKKAAGRELDGREHTAWPEVRS